MWGSRAKESRSSFSALVSIAQPLRRLTPQSLSLAGMLHFSLVTRAMAKM